MSPQNPTERMNEGVHFGWLSTRPNLAMLLAALLLFVMSPIEGKQPRWGHYVGDIKVKFDKNGRDLILLENFIYIDPKGQTWGAQAGWKVDGASIPQAFWGLVGGPLEGKYREASVIHDVACDQRTKPWKEVHQTFYTAMRCSGVEEMKAKIMYYAVYHFGPRWGLGPTLNAFFAPEKKPTDVDAKNVAAWIKKNNPNLQEIENAKGQPENLPTR
jgi:hypothetical protein